MGIVISTWVLRFIWESEVWDIIEGITLGLVAVLISIRIVQDTKKSNLQQKACSRGIEQISFICPPNLNSDTPFRKAGFVGVIIGIMGIVIIVTELTKITG